MNSLFEPMKIKGLELVNRFVFPPIKTGYGTPTGEVTERHQGDRDHSRGV